MKYKVGDKVILKKPDYPTDWSPTAWEWIISRKIVEITSIDSNQIWLDNTMWFHERDIAPAKRKPTILVMP